MGGSFKSTSYSRSYSSPSSSSYSSSPRSSSSRLYSSPRMGEYRTSSTTRVNLSTSYGTRSDDTIVRGPAGYIVPAAFFGSVVYLNDKNRKRERGLGDGEIRSALGVGVSVLKLSIALDVANRDDPRCILAKLKRLSLDVDTESRGGVQDLISDGEKDRKDHLLSTVFLF